MDVVLRMQRRLDSKWVKTDLQKLLDPDGLAHLWNEMVKDGEITGSFSDGLLNSAGITARRGLQRTLFNIIFLTIPNKFRKLLIGYSCLGDNGHYYCGMRVLNCLCCDGICGPQSGCNCINCQKLDNEEEARRFASTSPVIISSMIHQSWTWGRKPSYYQIICFIILKVQNCNNIRVIFSGSIELKDCLDALVTEQKFAGLDHASNSIFTDSLWMRLLISYRFFIALSNQDSTSPKQIKTKTNSSLILKDCRLRYF